MTGEGRFLTQLFAAFNAAGIRYAVMRNYDTLPDSAGGSDLDILVAENDRQPAQSVLRAVVRAAGGVPVGSANSFGFFKTYILGKYDDQIWWGLRVDVNFGLYYKGQPLLTETGGLFQERYNGISVLNSHLAAVLGVLKEGLNHSKTPARYLAAARKAAVEDWAQIEECLYPMGRNAVSELRNLLLSDFGERRQLFAWRRLRFRFLLHWLLQQPLSSIMRWIDYEWYKVRRYVRPSGMILSVLGVDGAGKSTVIDAIKPALDAATHNAVFVQHLRPSLLPPLARLKGKKAVQEGPVLDPHGSRPSGVLGSLIRMAYYTLDYIVGYWFKIRPRIAKEPAIVIYDRYAYDMAIDPRRFRIGLSGKVVEWFTRLAPKPDIIICLHAPLDTILSRKRELPKEEIHRQLEALHSLARKEIRAVLISNDGSVGEVREKVLQTLYEFLLADI